MATCPVIVHSVLLANQRSACPHVSRVWLFIHGGNSGAFDFAHIFLDDISALEYTGSVGSHRGEPRESISASLNFVSRKILAEIICDHAVNCSRSHLS